MRAPYIKPYKTQDFPYIKTLYSSNITRLGPRGRSNSQVKDSGVSVISGCEGAKNCHRPCTAAAARHHGVWSPLATRSAAPGRSRACRLPPVSAPSYTCGTSCNLEARG
eukprot:scaffold117006_cov71-Phaeocystis_antarctica.AAC.5